METTRICSGCGKSLAPNAPQGLCPQCLLKAGLGSGVDIGPDTQSGSGGLTFVAPPLEEIARLFPQLEILGFVGQGGMGAVYRARQKELDRVVALKVLPPDIGRDAAFAERFTRDLDHGVMALWSEPRYEQGALRFDVMHNADRERFALRMVARLQNGGSEKLVFHSGVLIGAPAKGFALVHGTEHKVENWLRRVKEMVIERTPWVRGEIRNIRLCPRDLTAAQKNSVSRLGGGRRSTNHAHVRVRGRSRPRAKRRRFHRWFRRGDWFAPNSRHNP